MNEKIFNFISSTYFYGPILIILSSFIVYKIISMILNTAINKGKTELEKKRLNTMLLLFKNIMKYVIIIIAVVLNLNIYGINTSSLLAGLGIAGVVVGLALQDALKDIIGGINIILENYYVLGDLIRFNDFTGTVIEFGLKSTKIKADTGEVLVLANRMVDKIINLSQKQAVIMIMVPTSSSCDSKKVRKALEKIIEEVKTYDYVEATGCEYTGIETIAPEIVTYTFKIKCKQGKQFELKRQLLEMVKEAYEKAALKLG